jgi:DNA-binding PadR family transcriptional regulator
MVLWHLFEGPTHVYRMQKQFEATAKGRVVNIRSRASLYQTLERLERHGLVEVADTVHVEGYPDRVIYAITDAGRHVAREWLREMLHTTDGDYPEFLAALSIVFGLPPEEARAELELRAARLAAQVAEAQAALTSLPPDLPRLFVLEEEYRVAVLSAEIAWLRGVIDDIESGRMTWTEEWLRELFEKFLSRDDKEES